ncbi:unnamed protein product [Oncorhynchus mykiss]|uniref:Putative monooxygenase p33MONOX n=1 Tax=Oncorhynchus mykiss TaxID=8022 RepID=A0A060Y6E8_ONCMY|nr:unnamed protein product [Oncorhynchus mykiss]
MGSRQGDIPALESGVSGGFFGGFSSPIGMSRRAFSYDEALDAPMHSPPPDMCVNNPWKDPLIPQRKFKRIVEEDESDTGSQFNVATAAAPVKPPVPVVKAKASSLMNTLMIKQTQESLQRFELQAGLTEAGYTPHKGLSAEDTRFHRLAEGQMPVSMTGTGGLTVGTDTRSAYPWKKHIPVHGCDINMWSLTNRLEPWSTPDLDSTGRVPKGYVSVRC